MRLLAWNVRQGGGSRLPRIAAALEHHGADILVLSEHRGGPSATRLRAALDALGYQYATAVTPPPGRCGVLIAARYPFREHIATEIGLPEPYRIVSVGFDWFRLIGVYMPNLLAKVPYWEALIATPTRRLRRKDACRRRFQHLPALPRRGGRHRPHRALHGQVGRDRILRPVASPQSGTSRIFLVQHAGKRVPYRSRLFV